MSNVLIVSKMISSPVEAIGLLLDGVGRLWGRIKTVNVSLKEMVPNGPNEDLNLIARRRYLQITVDGIETNKPGLASLVY